ncbi:paraquat-inducible protein A [Pedobacter sp. JY14-1]|uniref:paraquat-inducible protein A n=1 Tax=Pedobacter sp. JY14-1 TaxID=3034151 RepID=UPI0023E241D8|nr:paraquat-inducible protein A [Pedobacter sp. JY14-1]
MHTEPSKYHYRLSGVIAIAVMVLALAGGAWSALKIYKLSGAREQIKTDYSVANNITFGVFSIDAWSEMIGGIVERKIDGFQVSSQQKKELRAEVEEQLNGLISKTVREFNKPQKTLGGKLKKLAFNILVDEDELREFVPTFASTIVSKLTGRSSMKRLKYIASTKLDSLQDDTYDNSEPARVTVNRSIYKKYQVSNAAQFDHVINSQLRQLIALGDRYLLFMAAAFVTLLAMWWPVRKQPQLFTPAFILSALFGLVLLLAGIGCTVIEVDARIDSLKFTLLEEQLAFNNQVLFFQSKSIFAIVRDLFTDPKPDAVLVGILLLLFVILLPLVRLVGKGLYVCYRDCKPEHKLSRFLAFDLAKWDMADVMVVGVGMTYIGLNGILKSQLSNIDIRDELLVVTTSNATSLQTGYFLYIAFVIFTAILSAICRRIKSSVVPADR